MTWNYLKFLIHFIVQISASTSEWRGERLALTFLAPNNPSKAAKVLYQPCPENCSLSFQEPSMKHHVLGIDGTILSCTWCANLWSLTTCASAQSVDSSSANLSVSHGSISRLLNTLLFWLFQIYHSIHANWWSSIFGVTLQKRWSIFAKIEPRG